MAKAKMTPAQWAQARREWERDPTASYASIAAKFLISKALVGQRAASEKWQKGLGVPAHPKDTSPNRAPAPHIQNLQRAPSNPAEGESLDAHDGASRAESADAPDAIDLGEIGLPANFAEMSFAERLAAAEAAALKRIDEMIARQERASNAALSLLYSAMKASRDGDKNANARIRGAEVTHKALKLAHEEQRTQERQRVLRAYNVIEGAKPPKPLEPQIMIVFSDDSPLTGPAGRRIHCGEGYTGALAAMNLARDRRAPARGGDDIQDVEAKAS